MSRFSLRAWDGEEMHVGVGVDSENTFPQCITGGSIDLLRLLKLEDVILMQSTGLKDKNGKEIFEGDIVQIDKCESTAEIVFNGAFLYHTRDIYWHGELIEPNITKIIGNIYENPELVEGALNEKFRG